MQEDNIIIESIIESKKLKKIKMSNCEYINDMIWNYKLYILILNSIIYLKKIKIFVQYEYGLNFREKS